MPSFSRKNSKYAIRIEQRVAFLKILEFIKFYNFLLCYSFSGQKKKKNQNDPIKNWMWSSNLNHKLKDDDN